MNLYFARFLSISWRFWRWIELIFLSVLVYLVGMGLGKVSNFLAPKLPQFPNFWVACSTWSSQLIRFGQLLVIAIIFLFIVIVVVAKIVGVRIIRSNRLSSHLHRMLMTTVDQVPATDENRRNKAQNLANEKANRAVKRSFVLATKKLVVAYVRIPEQVQVKKVLTDYLKDVGNQLSSELGLSSSTWQDTSNGFTFGSYKIMVFKN